MVKIAGTTQPAEAARRGDSTRAEPMDVPPAVAEAGDGLDFTHVLRDCLACAVISVDHQGKINGFNSRAETLTRLKASRLLGKSMDQLPAPVRQALAETLSAGKSQADRQVILHLENHREVALQVSSSLVTGAGGKTTGAVAVLNDVSPAVKWEASMRRLDRLHSVGALSASMAHEVKNAFVAVKTFVDLLLEQNKQADLAEVVRLEMGRIDTLLSQMRKFSGPAKPQFSRIRLHFVLDKSLQLIQHLLADKKIKVTRAFAAPHDSLIGDADQLEQCFINLFFNALDALKPNGRLTVSTGLVPAGVKISGLLHDQNHPLLRVIIQDNGTGIPPENMERLFEPFFTTKPDGTGLGLAITRRIIQEHHGVIIANSDLDQGTTFQIILPTAARA
jgi:two-component system, NtrC family, sensor histidine kinase AtoS